MEFGMITSDKALGLHAGKSFFFVFVKISTIQPTWHTHFMYYYY